MTATVKVIVTVDGALEDEIEFDDVNIVHLEGGVTVIHRDAMKGCARPGLWYRVAHAAAWIAETGGMLAALEASMKPTKDS
ncbi:MAG TPA: hypothetical protein VG222_17680 [Vicinamibacterales bacterium]|nr:hypothetical protein [Vicinamibacterales bacterium]